MQRIEAGDRGHMPLSIDLQRHGQIEDHPVIQMFDVEGQAVAPVVIGDRRPDLPPRSAG
jgi:hypothetical protein